MLRDAIRLIAAALCCERKKTEFTVTPDPALGRAVELVLQLTGRVEISSNGTVLLDPPVRSPRRAMLRFTSLPKELFYLFAGVAAKLDGILQVGEVEGGVTREELQALSNAMGGVLAFSQTAGGVMLTAFSGPDGFDAGAEFPPAFAAGVLLGAALAEAITAFTPGEYAETQEVRWALEALKEFGCPVKELKGRVTVNTLKNRFDTAGGKRIRKKN